jgi:serine/threonine protein phosphatase 1
MTKRFNLIKDKSLNNNGSDYICSDIHGHFSLLEKKLNQIGFNPEHDRLFSLGDLIDRGDESADVFNWLEKPWFFAIQGNHERMLINALRSQSDHLRHQWFAWGGDWAEDLPEESLDQYCKVLEKLPLAIELEISGNRRVALVHASLPRSADWNQIKTYLQNIPEDKIDSDRLTTEMLWGRIQEDTLNSDTPNTLEPVSNINHVYHGHTIVSHYTTIGNRTFMDLCSYDTGNIGLLKPVDHMDLL